KWPYISLTLLLLLGTAVFVDYHTYNLMVPFNKVLTFNNAHFRKSNLPSAPAALNASGLPLTSPSANEDENGKQGAPLSAASAKKTIIPSKSLLTNNTNDSYANNDDIEITGPEISPVHSNETDIIVRPQASATA